jgi:hypothetical protein
LGHCLYHEMSTLPSALSAFISEADVKADSAFLLKVSINFDKLTSDALKFTRIQSCGVLARANSATNATGD